MARHLLITRPNHDYATRYLSAWAGKFKNLAKDKGYFVIDLYRKRANRQEVESVLNKRNPDLVVINGHGNDNLIAGQENEPLLIAGDNSLLLQNKITYAISFIKRASGKTSGLKSSTKFLGEIQELLTSKISPDKSSALCYLVWDMRNLVLCGQGDKQLA